MLPLYSNPLFAFAFTCLVLCVARVSADDNNVSSSETVPAVQRYQDNWETFGDYQTPEWYQDAKFGIWPHWGIYSVPAFRGEGTFPGEWYGRGMHGVRKGPETRPKKNDDAIINDFWDERGIGQAEHHQKVYGGVEKFGYHEFADLWKAEKFDADQWAQLAIDSGAKFFCMMAHHHDSFSLYDSDLTEFDSVDKGPKRDLCREMKEAATKRGLKFGLSNHMAWNPVFFRFYHSNYKHLPDYGQYADLYSKGRSDQEFVDRWWARTIEAADKLQPDLYYFDWGWHGGLFKSGGYHPRFAAHLYNNAIDQGKGTYGDPGVVMCCKDRSDPADKLTWDIERGRMGSIQSNVWQTDTSISVHSWGYSVDDEYHSVDYLIETLVDVVSKNGVLMLNFGPKADGTVPKEYRDRLLSMGEWLKTYGEAIYATRPFSIYRDALDRREIKVRYTRNKANTVLYATAFDWPGETLTLKSLNTSQVGDLKIKSVHLLGVDQELQWKQDGEGLRIESLKQPNDSAAYSFRIEFAENLPSPKN